ncbi:MAG: hypothetical protein WC516_08380 [Patescibacteria group bacterium]
MICSSDFIDKTTSIMHIYADGLTGLDKNSGIFGFPKKTILSALNLIPYYIQHNVCLHLSNTFEDYGILQIEKNIKAGCKFIIDGGSEITTIAGPFISDIHSISSIGLTTMELDLDQYAGYWVSVFDKPLRTIQKNNINVITPVRHYDSDPGPVAFNIVKPKTTLHANSGYSKLLFSLTGQGTFCLQRLCFSGNNSNWSIDRLNTGTANSYVSHIITTDTTMSDTVFGMSLLYGGLTDPNTFVQKSDITDGFCGVSKLNGQLSFYWPRAVFAFGCYVKSMKYNNGSLTLNNIAQGTRIKQLYLNNANGVGSGYENAIQNTEGYATTSIGGGTYGINLSNRSTLQIGSGVDVSNCSSHAIRVEDSRLILNGIITGDENIGAGIYANNNSTIELKEGYIPTITGNIGDLSFDGITEASTWNNINNVKRVIDSNELSLCKITTNLL